MGNQATSLRPEAISDLESMTNFTPEEIREYYKQFMKDTAEGRMTLSEAEFEAMYAKVFPQGNAKRFSQHVFRNFDKDGDGRINFCEFLSTLNVQLKGTAEEKLHWIFRLYDMDDSGYITRGELLKMITCIHRLHSNNLPAEDRLSPEQLVEYIMKKADQNLDDMLSKREFMEGAMKSKTIEQMVMGTMKAAGSPFIQRKEMKHDHK